MALTKKLIIPGAIVAAAVLGAIGSSGLGLLQADAATATDTQVNTTQTDTNTQDESVAHHTGANGTKEELLTDDTAEKAKAAALAANPGGTIERVETDAEGAAYEAHMTKADGSRITVKLDSSFKVTSTETGGSGGH